MSGPNAYGPMTVHSMAAHPIRGPEIKWEDQAYENQPLYHNASNGTTSGATGSVLTLTKFGAAGTGVNGRIGDRVHCKQVDVRLWLSNKLDRPNVIYRIVAALSPGLTGAAGPAWSTQVDSNGNCLVAMPSPDVCSFLYDKVVNPDQSANQVIPSAYTGKERSYLHYFSMPVNENLSVNSSNYCDISNIALYVVAYDAYGTLATDNIASFAVYTRTWYTDT